MRIPDERIQPNFWLSEFVKSSTAARWALDNTPPPEILYTIRTILAPGMQRVRNLLSVVVSMSSGYRAPAVNKKAKGSATSQHMKGEACDFTAPSFGDPRLVAQFIRDNWDIVQFDQLIYEGAWVHISFVELGKKPRRSVMTAHFHKDGSTTYSQGIQ